MLKQRHIMLSFLLLGGIGISLSTEQLFPTKWSANDGVTYDLSDLAEESGGCFNARDINHNYHARNYSYVFCLYKDAPQEDFCGNVSGGSPAVAIQREEFATKRCFTLGDRADVKWQPLHPGNVTSGLRITYAGPATNVQCRSSENTSRCMDGSSRTFTIAIHCAREMMEWTTQMKYLKVQEPKMCQFEVHLHHPAGCPILAEPEGGQQTELASEMMPISSSWLILPCLSVALGVATAVVTRARINRSGYQSLP